MAAGKIAVQANDTRVYTITPEDGAAGNVSITLPKEGGTVLTTNTAVPVDAVPTNGSTNPVSSDGVFEALAGKVSKTGDTMTGNLVFATGTKIQGDFDNATLSNRVAFQTSTVNGGTSLEVVPNGTGVQSTIVLGTDSAITNGSYLAMFANGGTSKCTIASGIRGTGTYFPLGVRVGGAERLQIDTSGNVLVTGSGGLGYGTGSGGTVTQLTSKSTAVTLNRPCGLIMMHNASLPAGLEAQFAVNNSLVTMSDTIIVHQGNQSIPPDRYEVRCVSSGVGGFVIAVKNRTGTAYSDALPINFAVIKGATS